MPIFHNLDGTTKSEFSIGKTNTIKFRTNSGIVEWQNTDGIWHKVQVQTYIKTTDPTVNDDIDQGYLVTDLWFNDTNDKVYICEDNANGAAVWTLISGGASGKETITQASHGFAAKDVIRRDTGGSYIKAKADIAVNAEAIGIVESVNGNDFTVVYSGRISGLSGLTDGSVYRLSDVTAGLLTTDAVAVTHIDKPMLVATSATSGIVINYRGNVVEYTGQLQSLAYWKPAINVGDTVFDPPWSYETGANRLWLWRNGILQIITTDFTETSSTRFTLTTAITESDEEIIALRMPNGEVPLLREVEASTGSNTLTDQESSKVLTNEGSTAKNYHTLPAAVAGLTYTFFCQDSDGIRITAAAGDTVRIYDQVSAAAGYCESTSIGSTVTLVAINTTEWVAIAALGSWTVI